jgi:predicted metal-dependent peptidase
MIPTIDAILAQLHKARTGLILDQSFWGTLALRLRLVEDTTVRTFCTDGAVIRYNPTYAQSLTLAKTKGVLGHEVGHCVFGHIWRADGRDLPTWNKACDYVLNAILVKAGFDLPDGALLDTAYDGLSAEGVYTTLSQQPKDPDGGNDGDGTDPCGDFVPGAGPDSAEMKEMAADWKVATIQAAAVAKGMGDLPGDLARLIDAALVPRIDWREILRQWMCDHARNDYSWARPNRRHIANGLYLPSLDSPSIERLTVLVDTSRSTAKFLPQFGAELNGILDSFESVTVDVVYCDTKVQGEVTFTPDARPVVFDVPGGGDTDLRPAFDHIAAADVAPSVLVVLTDLEVFGRFPAAPEYPVLWITADPSNTAPFGVVAPIDCDTAA